ncbi:hypothetical protein ACVHNB_24890 [Streptomyces sp. YJ-C3]
MRVVTAAATGGYALGAGGGRIDPAGLVLALAGMLAFAAYGFLYRRRLGDLPPSAALLGAATVMLLPFAAAARAGRRSRSGAASCCWAAPCTRPRISSSTG